MAIKNNNHREAMGNAIMFTDVSRLKISSEVYLQKQDHNIINKKEWLNHWSGDNSQVNQW